MVERIDELPWRWDHYSSHLSAMEEELLPTWAQNRNVEEAYRFTYLPTFDSPLTVRVWSTPEQEPPLQVIVKLGGGQGGYAPGTLQKKASWALASQDWTELLSSGELHDFWAASSWERAFGHDGESWIFEGYRAGYYKILVDWCGSNRFASTLGKSFSKLIPDGFSSFKNIYGSSMVYEFIEEQSSGVVWPGVAIGLTAAEHLPTEIEATAQAFQVEQNVEDIVRKARASSSVAYMYLAAGHRQQTLKIAQSIGVTSQKAILLKYIGDSYAAVGQIEQAAQIWTQAFLVAEALEGTSQKSTRVDEVLSDVPLKYAELGQLDKALQIAQQLNSNEKILAEIAVRFAGAGRQDQALVLANTFNSVLTKARALVQIAVQMTFAGQTEEADKIFTQSFQVAQTLKYTKTKIVAEMAISAAKVGRYNLANQIALSIEDTRKQTETFAYITYIYLEWP